MKYFKPKEFVCDGVECFDKMQPSTLDMLDKARELARVPFTINSSFRTKEKNEAIRGAKNSAHLRGFAVDIKCNNSIDRFKIIEALTKAGYTRIGIANTFIHCDNDPSLAAGVIWLY